MEQQTNLVLGWPAASPCCSCRSGSPGARAPLFAERFPTYGAAVIDGRLLGGAAIFGVGWALGGFCPGPALVSLASGMRAALVFVPAMAAGVLACRLWDRFASAGREPLKDAPGQPRSA
jgi:uncharacterized membrane protein YedE/YeeE